MKESQDDDIKINRRSGDRAIFESPFLQRVSDRIDIIKDESKDILKELDKANIAELDLEEVGENTLNQLSDVADELSQLKSEFINSEEFPETIRQSSRNIKVALNRDQDYLRRAQRRLDRIDSDEFVNVHKANIRVIELCNKAIEVDDSNYEAYYLKGLAMINLERYVLAIEEFITSIALNDTIKARIGIADANRLNGDYEDAIDVYDSIIDSDENCFDAYKGKAYTYYACQDYQNAYNAFKKAMEIESLDIKSKIIFDECLEKI